MSERDPNATYPIGAVERLTGLTAATIRAWERRYTAIEPVRTAGNVRRYTAENVRRLVLLRKATERGHSIAALAALDDGRLSELADAAPRVDLEATEAIGETHRPSPFVEEYLTLVGDFDVGLLGWSDRGAGELAAPAAAPRALCDLQRLRSAACTRDAQLYRARRALARLPRRAGRNPRAGARDGARWRAARSHVSLRCARRLVSRRARSRSSGSSSTRGSGSPPER